MDRPRSWLYVIIASVTAAPLVTGAQTPAPAPAPGGAAPTAAAASSPLEQLAWLRGCWAGKVGRRDFVEHWLPPRAGMMVGISHTIVRDKTKPGVVTTQSYEYLRLETRPDGVYYVVVPAGKKETAFRLASVGEQNGRKAYTFTSSTKEFPQRIVYMRSEEWLYATVAGRVGDEPTDKEVTYPMQHVDCATGAAVRD